MESPTKSMSYRDWRNSVDGRLQRIYSITIEDAGFDEEYLIKHWESNEAALEFVEWYGNKYDLDPVSSFILFHERSR